MAEESESRQFTTALTYANGYRELAMFDHALKELDGVSESMQGRKEYAQMRLAVLMDAQRWREALPYANRLASVECSDPGHLINLAYVTRRADSIDGAQAILQTAAQRFPDEATIQYNLACYACCQHELETAKSYLRQAFRLDPRFLETSQQDSDLSPLHSWINELASRRES